MKDPNYGLKFHFLRWVLGWVNILQGLAQVISLGFWQPSLLWRFETYFLEDTVPTDPAEEPWP